MMSSFWKMQGFFTGRDEDADTLHAQLQASCVPVTSADCRTCLNPCEEGHEAYPNRFDVDMETRMLGSVKPYRRQIVISTGKSDWDREITDTKGSLASYIQQVQHNAPRPVAHKPSGKSAHHPLSGVFCANDSTRVSILNGSHQTLSLEDGTESVLVFPDYRVVTEVSETTDDAQRLWDTALDPRLPQGIVHLEKSVFKTWVIPYSCVIMLCSHKKRDNRCGISAPKLERAFIQSLELNGWSADTQLEDPSCMLGDPLEELSLTPEETDERITTQLKEVSAAKKALIIRTSHIGGHKYAGNCVIYTPQGSSVWYGRVTPHEVDSIVVNTILAGLVLAPLLRGGLNISRPSCKSLNDW